MYAFKLFEKFRRRRTDLLLNSVRVNWSGQKGECYTPEIEKMLSCRKDVKLDICLVDSCMIDPMFASPKVVVVGAGVAGLSAAHRLSQSGVCELTVLEATDRPGGRVQSCWLDEAVVELGSQWLEGASVGNPMFTLACQEGLVDEPFERRDLSRAVHMTSEGRDLNTFVDTLASHSFKLIDDQAAELYSDPRVKDYGNLADFIAERASCEIRIFPEDKRRDAGRVINSLANEVRARMGADLCRVSANSYGSSVEIPGGSIRVSNGMIGCLAPLVRDLPACCVRYCKPVEKILWCQKPVNPCDCPPRVTVVCCDGHEFPADYVIVTVSLGVLKDTHKNMFDPPLPREKVEAIEKVGFGHVNNVYVDYTDPFWVWREGSLRLAWSTRELTCDRSWLSSVSLIEEMPGSRQVLMCSVAGKDEAEYSESLSDVKLVQGLTALVRQFTGDPTIPYPANVVRSKWTCDPFFRGARSYLPLGTTVSDLCNLGNPYPPETCFFVPKLLFAGEATCPGYNGTVHGARFSGLREADRILKLTQRLRGPPPR